MITDELQRKLDELCRAFPLSIPWPARPDSADVMEIETVLDVEGLEE